MKISWSVSSFLRKCLDIYACAKCIEPLDLSLHKLSFSQHFYTSYYWARLLSTVSLGILFRQILKTRSHWVSTFRLGDVQPALMDKMSFTRIVIQVTIQPVLLNMMSFNQRFIQSVIQPVLSDKVSFSQYF